jgi:hypothetical protein
MNHWNNFYYWPWMSFGGGLITGLGSILLAVIIVWSIVWKGLALWKAARDGSKTWFIVLLILNTLGILDILYLYVFSKKSWSVFRRTKNNEQRQSVEESKTE